MFGVVMARTLLADFTISISEFKKNPMAVVEQGEGFPVVVLKRNQPVFYCVPAEAFKLLIEKLDDVELCLLIQARNNQEEVIVNLDKI